MWCIYFKRIRQVYVEVVEVKSCQTKLKAITIFYYIHGNMLSNSSSNVLFLLQVSLF